MSQMFPDLETFNKLIRAEGSGGSRTIVPVCRRLFSDTLTAVLAYRRLVQPDSRLAPSFLLESVVGERIGRYSYIGAQPIGQIIARSHEVQFLDHRDRARSRTFTSDDPLAEMDRLTGDWKRVAAPGLPPFTGGWVGCVGYDSVRYLEPSKLMSPPPDDRGLPDIDMQLYLDVIAFDHVNKTALAITNVLVDEHPSVEVAFAAATQRLDHLVHRLLTPRFKDNDRIEIGELLPGDADLESPPPQLPTSNMGKGGYQKVVERCKKYIASGDCFQVVPSQRFDIYTDVDPFDIYRALRVINPTPYMFYVQVQGAILVASSPEILCRVQDGLITGRPLAGTRRRGGNPEEDLLLEAELKADPKDVAEHLMLVDLGRNDIGRVGKPGTIALPQVFQVERYSHVMHLSSTVTGELAADLNCWDALRVTLPVGTVSGAPKVRAMQIIDELEPARRGPYGGAVGYTDFAGNMDMAIALRTMVVLPQDSHVARCPWRVDIQAGAGIVADSDPDLEHQETLNKAAAFSKTIDLAQRAFGT